LLYVYRVLLTGLRLVPDELPHIVADDVHFQTLDDPGVFQGFVTDIEAYHRGQWQDVNATEVEVGVRGGKSVEVGAADRREHQRVWLGFNDAL